MRLELRELFLLFHSEWLNQPDCIRLQKEFRSGRDIFFFWVTITQLLHTLHTRTKIYSKNILLTFSLCYFYMFSESSKYQVFTITGRKFERKLPERSLLAGISSRYTSLRHNSIWDSTNRKKQRDLISEGFLILAPFPAGVRWIIGGECSMFTCLTHSITSRWTCQNTE